MIVAETVLLIVAYSTLLIAIFVSIFCYRRNLEKPESIAFAVSLLLLIVAITTDFLFKGESSAETTSVYVLLSMIIVGLTTPLSVMAERKHAISRRWKRLLVYIAAFLVVSAVIALYFNKLSILEYFIGGFLGISVMLSMILTLVTKPLENLIHLERTNRIFSVLFLVLVPASLIINYLELYHEYRLKVGIILPLGFTLLAMNKLMDDLQRLSLIKVSTKPLEQHFHNYSFSKRERDVARLLVTGKTYKNIAEQLHVSMPTVKTHASHIYKKSGVIGRHELTVLLTS